MAKEAGYQDADGGVVVFKSQKDQPLEAFDAAFKQHLVGQPPAGFTVERMESMKQSGLLHDARQFFKGARQSVTDTIAKGLSKATFGGSESPTGRSVIGLVNPVPGTTTDAGQLGGAAMGALAGSLVAPGPGTAVGAILGGGLGRMGGSMAEEKPDPYAEGAMGLGLGLVPPTLKAGSFGTRTVAARSGEQKVVRQTIDQLQTMLPQGAPKLSKNVVTFQKQMSATGKDSLVKWAKDEFQTEIDQINAAVGTMQVRIPSLGSGPVKVSDVIEAITEKGQRMAHGQTPVTMGQKVAAVGQGKIREELDFVLRSNGLDAVADGYNQARNNFARSNEVVRLFTQASEKKRPLDLASGKIDLAKLQKQFLETRQRGGLRPFTDQELAALEEKLGRGVGLAGVDQPMDLPGLISLGLAPGRNAGVRIAAPSIPRAAGVSYVPPSMGTRLALPQLLGQQTGEEK
jgi:hypothetical protein